MEKIIVIVICFVICFSCNNRDNSGNKRSSEINKKYDIDFITYWETKINKDSIPLSIIKIDTINFLGMNIRFNEKGDTIEKIVLLDRRNAFRFYYHERKVYMSNLCFYEIRKNSPRVNDYSLVLRNYGYRNFLTDTLKNDIFSVNGNLLEGPNICFYENKKVKFISYYVNSEIQGEKIYFDSINGNVTKKEYYDKGKKIK